MPKVHLDTGRIIEKVKYDSVEVSGKFVQIYSDAYGQVAKLNSPCAIHLLFWIADNMGGYNQISLNKNSRYEFIADTRGKYKDQTVKNAVSALRDLDLIVSMNEAGRREAMYFVNPFHFWRGNSQKDRAEAIKGFLYRLKENERDQIRQRSKREN